MEQAANWINSLAFGVSCWGIKQRSILHQSELNYYKCHQHTVWQKAKRFLYASQSFSLHYWVSAALSTSNFEGLSFLLHLLNSACISAESFQTWWAKSFDVIKRDTRENLVERTCTTFLAFAVKYFTSPIFSKRSTCLKLLLNSILETVSNVLPSYKNTDEYTQKHTFRYFFNHQRSALSYMTDNVQNVTQNIHIL